MKSLDDKYSYDILRKIYDYNMAVWKPINIFGIRNEADFKADRFNDVIGICGESTENKIILFQATTDPGIKATREHRTGASHLIAGFYKDVWTIEYRKRFDCKVFVQVGKVSTREDTNRDGIIQDSEPTSTDMGPEWGIFLHPPIRINPDDIGDASWGCQVARSRDEYLTSLLPACEASGMKKFSYLLVNKSEETDQYFTM